MITLERDTIYTRMDSDAGGSINTHGHQLTFGKTDGSTVDSTFKGRITGLGSLTLNAGAGRKLILTGYNTYTGGTTVTSGTLQLGDGTSDGNIIGNTLNNDNLIFNPVSTVNFKRTISGNGTITKTGPGKLLLSGNHNYTGTFTINAGTLQVHGSINPATPFTVASGTILATDGPASVGALTTDGTLAPGRDVRTMTIKGNCTLNASGVHRAEIDPPGKTGFLHVTGNASLSGVLNVVPINAGVNAATYTPGTEYILLQADGTLTDNLQRMSVNGASFLNYEKAIKNGHTLIFKVKSNSLPAQMNASTFGLQATASQALITTLSERMMLFASIASQSSNSQGSTLPGQGSSREIGNKMEENTFAFMHNNLRAQVRGRTQPSRSLLQTGPAPKDEALTRLLSAMKSQGTQALKKDAYTLWVSALYTQGKNDKTAISSASSDHQHGAVIGFEYVTPNKQLVGISLAAGLGHAHARANRDNKSDHKYSQIGVYHSVEFLNNTWLNSQLAYSYMRSENQRLAIPNIGSSFLAHSASRLHTVNLVEELAYAMKLTEATTLRVGYGFNYWRLHRGAYGEGDAGALAQFFPRITRHGFDHQATARLHYGWNTESYHLGLAGSLKYALTVSGYRLKDTVYPVGGPDAGFAITAPGLGRGTLSPSLTFSGQHKDKGPKLSLSYTANLQVKRKAHELYLEARWSF